MEYGKITVLKKDWTTTHYGVSFISEELGSLQDFFLNLYFGKYYMEGEIYEQATIRVIFDPDRSDMKKEGGGWKYDHNARLQGYYGKIKPVREED